jgi:protein disulfide-isomerase A1
MTKIFVFAILALLALSVYADAEIDEGVLVFTNDNFDTEIAKYENILVEFYAPWCGHCQQLAPEYSAAAKTLAEANPPQYLAKVDVIENKELGERFGIDGFPDLKWFVNGVPSEYPGGRTAAEFVGWIKKETGPPSTEADDEAISKLLDVYMIAVVFYGDAESPEFETYLTAAKAMQNTFYHTHASDAALPEGLTRPGLVVKTNFDSEPAVYTGKFTVEDIAAFITEESIPTLIRFTESFVQPIFHKQQPAVFLFVDEENEEHIKLVATLREAAKANKQRILYVHSVIKGVMHTQLATILGITQEDLPLLMVIGYHPQGIYQYRWDGDITALSVDDLDKFVTQFEEGSLTKFMKSEEIPEKDDGHVKIIVGKNFADVVGHKSDVLVEFYSPADELCKELEPKYSALAEELKDVEGLVIAKCDATANEIESVHIAAFPTIKFYKAGSTDSVDYAGEKEVESFKKYLNEHSEVYKAYAETKEDL